MKNQVKKKLSIYDFDNTICMISSKVHCLDKKTKIKWSMHPQDYTNWREEGFYDHDPKRYELDFSEFQGYPKNGVEHKWVTNFLRKDIKDTTIIPALVTGRDTLYGLKKWLIDQSINAKAMVLMCSGDPNKRMCYKSLICTFEPDEVIIYEDGFPYIEQCWEVCQKFNLNLSATHIISQEEFRVYNYNIEDQ